MVKPPRLTIVVTDLSLNCLGRAYLLGKMAEPAFEITLVGFTTGPLWEPLRNLMNWQVLSVDWPAESPSLLTGDSRRAISKLAAMISADVIICSKAWFRAMTVTALASRRLSCPVILDIDDWEAGWFFPLNPRKALSMALRFFDPDALACTALADSWARFWATRTVSNRFLQRRFGGHYLPHGADITVLDPARAPSREEALAMLGLDPEVFRVGFVGTPRAHKGVFTIVKAVELLGRPDIRFCLAGVEPGAETGFDPGGFTETVPVFSKDRLPAVLSAMDAIVVPQESTVSTRGQIPAKIFDAMAMARPIIATRVSDIPEILGGAGLLTKPGDAAGVAAAILALADSPDKGKALGARARERCVNHFSLQALGAGLNRIVRSLL